MRTPPNQGQNSFLLQQYLRAAASASQARDFERALAIGDEATSRGVEHPELLSLAAQLRLRKGDIEGAYPLLVRACEISPRSADIMNALGICLTRLGRAREALRVFDAAMRQAPGSAALHFGKALAHEQLSELDRERRQLERVIAIEPNHCAALNLLALLAADRNDDKATREYAGRALGVSPDEVLSKIALATVDVAAGNFAAARIRLESLLRDSRLDPDNRSTVQTLMGDLLDGEGRHAEAFRMYAASMETLRVHYASVYKARQTESVRAQTARLGAYFRDASWEAWHTRRHDRIEGAPRAHVFLVGFLRSGTTLLGQILASHPNVDVMHERDCLGEPERDFIETAGDLDRLAALPEAALEAYRRSYWQKAQEFGHFPGRDVFVDKSPLGTALLPLIAKLFPDAKILFAYRDPRDVVLSCFRRRFAMNERKFEMLSLEAIASWYTGVMDLSEIYRHKLSLEVLDARHETLIVEFESESRRICDFLGIEWNAAMGDFANRARGSNIDTPNSAQLARGLSRDGLGQWRHYEKELSPLFPLLAPWCARFGYPEN